MDGTLAGLYLIASLFDMAMNDCPTGCLSQEGADSRLWAQAAIVQFNETNIGEEIYVGFDLGTSFGPFQPTLGASVTDDEAYWVGAGVKTQWDFGNGVFVEGSIMPGLFDADQGPDLGGNIQFRSSLGAGYEFANGGQLSIHYDHRSNADLEPVNPGLETIGIRYWIQFN